MSYVVELDAEQLEFIRGCVDVFNEGGAALDCLAAIDDAVAVDRLPYRYVRPRNEHSMKYGRDYSIPPGLVMEHVATERNPILWVQR